MIYFKNINDTIIELFNDDIFIGKLKYEYIDNLNDYVFDINIKNVLFITKIEIEPAYIGMGYGTTLLQHVLKLNIPVYVNAMPIGKLVTLNYLINFYSKFGFKIINKYKYNCEMIYDNTSYN